MKGDSNVVMCITWVISGALMSIHVAVGLVPVKRFDHEGLHQLQNCFAPVFYWNQTYSYMNTHQSSINLLDNVV